MKNLFYLLILVVTLLSCKNKEQATIELPKPKLIGTEHNLRDSTFYVTNIPKSTLEDDSSDTSVIRNTELAKQIIPESKTIKDTIFHYYVNNKVSVKITPWVDGKREIKLYDLYGNNTYNCEEVNMSYTVFCDLFFANNGSVEKMSCRTNPGASRFWHESEISFNGTNTPLWMKTYTKPIETIEDAQGETYYWDKKSNNWKKQEVINCNPPR
jgi:hypothetical protein